MANTLVTFLILISSSLFANEGMWLFNRPPLEELKNSFNFEPTQEWLEHLRKSSVRFNDGGSGSLISSTGLVLTNHHVASETLHEISTAENDYLEKGFLAKTQQEEIKAPGLTLEQLMVLEDRTEQVKQVVTPDLSQEDAAKALNKITSELENECHEKHGYRGELVKLFNGAQFHLYCYKEYRDVRLVFAPEKDIAFFGGDPDNFEFPRYDLDMAIFRVYENDAPAKQENFLAWSANGAPEGELVFVSGHPGQTQRMFTVDALKFLRDTSFKFLLDWLKQLEISLQQYMQESPERKRQAMEDYFGIQNSRKAYQGMRDGLYEPRVLLAKQKLEYELRGAAESRPELQKYARAWDQLAATYKTYTKGKLFEKFGLFEGRRAGALPMALNSQLYGYARHLVRLSDEDFMPNSERLPEYQDAARAELIAGLTAEVPVYSDFEIAKLANSLGFMVDLLGQDNATVQKVLQGKDPITRAVELVKGCSLSNVEIRKYLLAGDSKETRRARIRSSVDPMILLARALDKTARGLRQTVRETVTVPQNRAFADIAAVTTAVKGTETYPDATFTLRLSYGAVKGIETSEGQLVSPETTLGGVFEQEDLHAGEFPWELPESWHKAKETGKLNLSAPLNFICTADIIGGNSGSPVVNRQGELVGLIFDGNIQSLTGNYEYADSHRAVSVHSSAMMESLKNIYGAEALAAEIGK